MKAVLACVPGSECSHERDKGYAWVIAAAAFVASGATFGIWKTLQLFFNDWSEEFEATPAMVSSVQSISFAVMTCASPVAGFFVRKFGSRPTVILGGILASVGAGLSFFANSLTLLYLFIGGICHFGICLTYLPSFISLGTWMDKRRSLANSIAEMGGPLLATILPLVFEPIREAIGWRYTMLIASGLYLFIIIAGILQKPFNKEEKTKEKLDAENNLESELINGKPEVVIENADSVAPIPLYRRPAVIGKIAFYMVYCLFQFGGLFALNLFIQPYATEDRKFTSKQASYLLSINGALDLIGRPVSGVILSLPIFSKRRIELISVFMALYGLVCFLFRFAHSYYFFATLYGAAGLLFGFWNGTYWTVIPDLFGEELFPLAASCGMTMGGIALLLTAPIAGELVATSVKYDGVAYQSSIQLFIAAILLYFLQKNYPCCKIELSEKEGDELVEDRLLETNHRVGEKLAAVPLNTEQQISADFLSLPLSSNNLNLEFANGGFRRKTYSVVDLALSMTPGHSMLSLNKSHKSTFSLSKEISNELKPPQPLTHTTKSATDLR